MCAQIAAPHEQPFSTLSPPLRFAQERRDGGERGGKSGEGREEGCMVYAARLMMWGDI
jgi:hypothetical protein